MIELPPIVYVLAFLIGVLYIIFLYYAVSVCKIIANGNINEIENKGVRNNEELFFFLF